MAVSNDPQLKRIKAIGTPKSLGQNSLFYVDVNANYRINNKGMLVVDNDAVRQKIMNVLSVLVGEEHFEPTWGSNLPLRLFEPVITDGAGGNRNRTAYLMETDTIGALTTFMESEIDVVHSDCSITPSDDLESYMVDIVYVNKRTKRIDSLKFRLLSR